MKKNSSNSTSNDLQISDEMRTLVLQYMTACNNEDYAKADKIMYLIRKYNESHN